MSAGIASSEAESMRFALDESQQALRAAAAEVFTSLCPDERVAQVQAAGDAYDERLWRGVIDAGLMEAMVAETAGGAGLGMVGLALVLAEQGRRLGAVPLAPSAVSAMLLAQCAGGPRDLLAGLLTGDVRIALVAADARRPITVEPAGGPDDSDHEFTLTGGAALAWHGAAATHLLVTAETADGPALWLVERARAGIATDPYPGVSGLWHLAVELDAVRVRDADRIRLDETDTGARAVALLWARMHLGVAALQLGVCQEALRRTAAYTSEREQFGRPLATNQGVALRAADAYIDTEAIRLTLLSAAWRLDRDGTAPKEVLVARWWANEGTYRVVHTSQHLHGGMGADLDNHIHRFFVWGRELDVLHGSAPQLLAGLGRHLAEDPTVERDAR